MRAEDLTDLRELVRSRVIPGFVDRLELEADVRDWAEDVGADTDDALAVARQLWAQRIDEQRGWSDTGDYGRLADAFAELDAAGILARMNFSCCSRCATQEIDAQRTPDPDRDDWYLFREWAYVFFHEQDAERLADDDPMLYLGYSAFRPHPSLPEELLDAMSDGDVQAERTAYERTETLVGEQIVATLQRHGLDVRWSQARRDRIVVHVPQWRKPLPHSGI
ncbi:hypothetical protein AAFP35_06445 [Gordonia sp. CPCC 206044]|uniref:DUF6891 domain-containing protein n=1 Tax=Gordonia sp. CPCC 206044 TaxID=3140793 RepID=UPI003AF341C6